MKSLPFANIRFFVIIVALCILTGGIGYRLGERKTSVSFTPDKRIVVNQNAPASVNVNFSLFWDVWQRVTRSYIDRATIDPQKMVWGAISGMVNALGDPYTTFLPPQDNKDFKENLGGAFEGIGAQLGMKDNRVMVIAPLKGMPAEAAGILAGDYIMKVNGQDTTGWSVNETVNKIRGPKGTTVKLSILHPNDGKPVDISIVRNTINVPSVVWWIKPVAQITEISGVAATKTLPQNGTMAYIQLSQFGDNTNADWEKAVSDVLAAGSTVKGLVLDLRNNPGGYLDGAVYIASEFVKNGTMIVSQVNSDGTKQDYPVDRRGRLITIPMVVLINKGSASAAEIVSGALRDYKRATLVGETSFGKGSVQTPEDLPDGSSIHITTGRWLLPNGDSISKKGITPDIVVATDTFNASADAQLEKAVDLLVR
ncbi:MAG: S41 family peptidase [Candidatus Gottesmanbacteria bacterium]|nr:S41 family peptidase [Candidatus Gottesmanbacteria bacterium]